MKLRNPLRFNEGRVRAQLEAWAFELSHQPEFCSSPTCDTCRPCETKLNELLRAVVEARLRLERDRHESYVAAGVCVAFILTVTIVGIIL